MEEFDNLIGNKFEYIHPLKEGQNFVTFQMKNSSQIYNVSLKTINALLIK